MFNGCFTQTVLEFKRESEKCSKEVCHFFVHDKLMKMEKHSENCKSKKRNKYLTEMNSTLWATILAFYLNLL